MTRACAIVACSLVMSGCFMTGAPLRTDFATDPEACGWALVGPKQDVKADGAWLKQASGSERGSIVATTGRWESPSIKVRPFQYYQLTFASKSEGKSYWAAKFYDAAGVELAADHYSSIDAGDDWARNEFCFRGKAKAVTAKIWFEPLDGKTLQVADVKVAGIKRRKVAEWADRVCATIPPVTYTPPADRWRHIPRTMEKLRKGGRVRIVLLGDSIANDMGNSPLDVLLERLYPKAEVELITSVRGAAGCQYYKDQNRVKEYVVDHNPDLLIIAGISHGHKHEPMRSVIRQVREQIDPEVMVMTGAVVQLEWYYNMYVRSSRLPREKALEIARTFPARVAAMAREENAEFLDMRRAWDEYIENSGADSDLFRRDIIHANVRGRQVLARILERYFAPAYKSGTTAEAWHGLAEEVVRNSGGDYGGCMRIFTPTAW